MRLSGKFFSVIEFRCYNYWSLDGNYGNLFGYNVGLKVETIDNQVQNDTQESQRFATAFIKALRKTLKRLYQDRFQFDEYRLISRSHLNGLDQPGETHITMRLHEYEKRFIASHTDEQLAQAQCIVNAFNHFMILETNNFQYKKTPAKKEPREEGCFL
jgi:hypothetical protein